LLLGNGVNMELQDAIWVGDIAAAGDTRKWSGEQAEAAFLHKATGLGLSVLTPWGDSERYDLVAGSGKRLWRVQVKSTRYVAERRFSITARSCTDAYNGGGDRFSGSLHCAFGFLVRDPGEGFCAEEVSAVLSRGRGFARAV
jgi:PD-(D/E)XK endonuclease